MSESTGATDRGSTATEIPDKHVPPVAYTELSESLPFSWRG